ncbi:transposable element Tc1 transposase [Trichonephila clavipes]|nr:transposable element Tc1 transposase [Trichonephila clavipes]
MDHELYVDILNSNRKESAKKLGLDGNFIFQQDNDPKHTARNVKMWCLFHCKQQLHTPPQSPDINVIENLWVTLETAVQKYQIRNKAHLKQVLQEEWDKISPDTTKKIGRIGTKTFGGHYKSQRTCNQILTLSLSLCLCM